MKMKITQDLLVEFLNYYKNDGRSKNTIYNYRADFLEFIEFLKGSLGIWGDVEISAINAKSIEDYKTKLAEKRTPKTSIYYGKTKHISPKTIQGKILSIRAFLIFLNDIYETGFHSSRVRIPKATRPPMEFLSREELSIFVDHVDTAEKYAINRLRSKLLILLGATSGLRLSEILSLSVGDIYKSDLNIIGKGAKDRLVFITDSIHDLMDQYMHERSRPIPRTGRIPPYSDRVFISHNEGYDYGNPISKQTVCGLFKKYSEGCGLNKRITCHTMRHTFATILLEENVNLREIQTMLGHSDLKTTEGYTHCRNSKLKSSHQRVFS